VSTLVKYIQDGCELFVLSSHTLYEKSWTWCKHIFFLNIISLVSSDLIHWKCFIHFSFLYQPGVSHRTEVHSPQPSSDYSEREVGVGVLTFWVHP